MNELIKIHTNEKNETLVNGRELHGFLDVKTEYTKWFERMTDYGFSEGIDFSPFLTKTTNGRPKQDHALTLDMAKEISMIQRTPKGKEARQYFIEVEKQAKAQPINNTELLLETALHHERKLTVVHQRLDKLENETTLSSSQRRKIQGKVQSTVIRVLGGKNSNAYKNKSVNKTAFSSCYNQLKAVFDVASYMDIPKISFDEALDLIPRWAPTLELQSKIDYCNGNGELWE